MKETYSKKYKRRSLGCGCGIILLLISLALGTAISAHFRAIRLRTEDIVTAPPPPTYEVTLTNVIHVRSFPAQIQARETVVLSAAVQEDVTAVYVHIGDSVTQGQVLVTLDHTYARNAHRAAAAALQEAMFSYSNALTDLRNNETLFRQSVIGDDALRASRIAYQRAHAAWEKAHATYDDTALRLSHCTIRAPTDGRISTRMVERGERVTPNQPLLRMVVVDELILQFFVEDRAVPYISRGDPTPFTLDFLPHATYTATVARVGADVEPDAHVYRVEALYTPRNRQVQPGMFARVHMPLRHYKNVLFIPSYAITLREDGAYVTVYTPEETYDTPVITGEHVGKWTEIRDGLSPGMRILLQ